MGDFFNTPDFFWGAIVLAAATSLPDAIVSIKQALKKNGVASLANVIGSNIFDLLIAVPAGVLIAGAAIVNFSVAAPMILFLALSTIVILILLLVGNQLTKANGWVLIGLYFLFILWITLETVGVLKWTVY
jgi:cation:H+ antiporter